MNLSFDTIIVGSGLGGATVAATLCTKERILIVDAGEGFTGVYAGASSIGSGISSPLMSRRARPVWRMESANTGLNQLIERTSARDLFSRQGILKADENRAGKPGRPTRLWTWESAFIAGTLASLSRQGVKMNLIRAIARELRRARRDLERKKNSGQPVAAAS